MIDLLKRFGVEDEKGKEVNVKTYRSMIRSLLLFDCS